VITAGTAVRARHCPHRCGNATRARAHAQTQTRAARAHGRTNGERARMRTLARSPPLIRRIAAIGSAARHAHCVRSAD
jgi:hypothetical protein